MHIHKSFQLLSADNSKLATDETSRQNASDIEVEFSELLGVELESQEQQSSSGTDKKTGQEVAALLMPHTKTATASLVEGESDAQALAEKALAEKSLSEESLGEPSLSEASLGTETLAGTSAGSNSQAITDAVATQRASKTSGSEKAALRQSHAPELDTVQPINPSPWLTIISQSNDFNSILSQNSASSLAASTGESQFTSAESLVADVLGVPATGKTATNVGLTASIDLAMTDATIAATAADEQQLAKMTASGTDLASLGDAAKAPADGTLLNLVAEKQGGKAQSVASQAGDAAVDTALETPTQADRSANSTNAVNPDKMPVEQQDVRELFKTDKPHQQNQPGATSEQQPVTAEQDTAAATDQHITTGSAAVAFATRSQTPQQQLIAEAIVAPESQTESNVLNPSPTAPGDIELPIDVTPDFAALGTIPSTGDTATATAVTSEAKVTMAAASTVATVATSAAAVAPAKNTSPSFAQFQKAVNAAASLVQKQQQAEQTQLQPLQELAAQQPTKVAELSVMMSGQHTETPTAFNALLQTERPISSSGSAMGSSTGQHQQQAASQLFAAKLNDQVASNTQPALNLLEPSAAAQLKERVMFQVNQKIQSAEIKLAPEELGNMQIKVQMQQEQLSVQFVVQQAGAKEALEQQMPRLREMLEEQGIELTQGQVSQQREGSAEQRQARERQQGLDQMPDIGDEPLQQQAMVRVSDRMVDYYA